MASFEEIAGPARQAIIGYLADLATCLRFYSILPVPSFEAAPHEMGRFAEAQRALPVAGALLGLIGAIVLLIAHGLHAPAWVAAGLGVAALMASSGAMHEDGFADMADGLGGATPERSLEIMKDSRLGTYGVLALVFSIGLRTAVLAALTSDRAALAAAAVVAGASLSRYLGLLPLVLLEPARPTGAGQSAGRPKRPALVAAGIVALVIALLPALAGANLHVLCIGIILSAAAALGVTKLAALRLGGQTGDVCGAAQQAAELAFLCAISTLSPL